MAEQRYSGYVVPRSNFAGRGPMKVGSGGGVNRFGTFDMAGNVQEWCWNRADPFRRYILGPNSASLYDVMGYNGPRTGFRETFWP